MKQTKLAREICCEQRWPFRYACALGNTRHWSRTEPKVGWRSDLSDLVIMEGAQKGQLPLWIYLFAYFLTK